MHKHISLLSGSRNRQCLTRMDGTTLATLIKDSGCSNSFGKHLEMVLLIRLYESPDSSRAMSDFPKELDIPTSSATMKTLRYKQDSIHDFAWFADKRWHVLKGEVELPISKRKVTTWSFFTNAEAEMWRKAPEYISNGIRYMSN